MRKHEKCKIRIKKKKILPKRASEENEKSGLNAYMSSAIRSVFVTEFSEGLHEKKIFYFAERLWRVSSGFSCPEQWLFNENLLKRMEKLLESNDCNRMCNRIWFNLANQLNVPESQNKICKCENLQMYSSASHKPLLSVSARNCLALNNFQVPKWKIQIHIGGKRITTICAYWKGGIDSHVWNMVSTLEIENETPTSARRAKRDRQWRISINELPNPTHWRNHHIGTCSFLSFCSHFNFMLINFERMWSRSCTKNTVFAIIRTDARDRWTTPHLHITN